MDYQLNKGTDDMDDEGLNYNTGENDCIEPALLFCSIGFTTNVPSNSLKKSIAHMSQLHSLILYGSGELLKIDSSKKRCKVLYTHANVKFMAKFEKKNKKKTIV